MKRIFALFFVVVIVAACKHPSEQSDGTTGNKGAVNSATLYYGGDILTMEGKDPVYVEALVQKDGLIAFTGSLHAATQKFGNAITRVDLKGATLLPGFLDGHGHLYNTGFMSLTANILPPPDGPAADFDQLVQTVRAWKDSEDGKYLVNKLGWIIGNGYDDSQLKEKNHPTREILDKISTDIPVLLIHQSGHIACVNSKGLALAGYNSDTKPMAGGIIRRDAKGNPNGVLEEDAFFSVMLPILAKKSDADLQLRSVQKGQESYAKYGYTTAQDGRSTSDNTDAFELAVAQNKFFIDVVAYPDLLWNKKAVKPAYYSAKRTYNQHYRVGGVKLTLDGSPQGKTAWLTQCYHVNPEGKTGCYKGYSIMTDEQAKAWVDTAYKHQWQLLCHSNGDAAIDQLIKAVTYAQQQHNYADPRTVLIHGQTLRKDQIPSLVSLKIFPSLFPMHTFYWGDWHEQSVLGSARASYISPCRDVLNAGLLLTSHHDAPVTFPNSMRVLDATVNRVTRSGKVLGKDQCLTPYEGLQTFTHWAAIQYFEEDKKGTLTAGKLADLVILDNNPLKIDPLKIQSIQILETIKEGKTVYKRTQ